MQYLLLGIGLLIVLILLIRAFVSADPKKLAHTLQIGGFAAAGAIGLFLLFTGRLGMILWLLPVLIPLLMRWRMASGRAKAAAGPTPGQSSAVETAMLRMWLDHDTGQMDGEVKTGLFTGRTLSSLSQADLLELLHGLGGDPQSAALVEAFLDRAYPDWREAPREEEAQSPPARSGGMSREEALEILGLSPEAGPEEVKDAHRRLMLRNHPDQGGSTYIAAKLNQAKDVLLAKGRTSP